jgi:hypothetical protein|tara:strand:- start:298 stop:1008 length:711 start_codon:yes stop_codon:yes gene_type:complete
MGKAQQLGKKIDAATASAQKQVKSATATAQKQAKAATATAQKQVKSLAAEFNSMPKETQQKLLMGGGAALALVAWCGVFQGLLIFGVAALMSSNKPTQSSFDPWFKAWFVTDFYPPIAERARDELTKRASKRCDPLGAIFDTLKGWVVDKTKSLQAGVMHSIIAADRSNFEFTNLGVATMATVRMGKRDGAARLRFFGVFGQWLVSPVFIPDVEDCVQAAVDVATAANGDGGGKRR